MPSLKKVPPTEAFFLLCEDIREEAGNKYSLLGVFSGDVVVLPVGTYKEGVNLSSLCVFAKFVGGRGEFVQRIAIKGPGKLNTEIAGPLIVLEAEKRHVSKVQIRPFAVDGLGEYRVTLSFDENEYSYTFSIQEG